MELKTRFKEGDYVFCLDKKGQVKERLVMGVRTQSLFGKQKTNYSFVKDGYKNYDFTGEMPDLYFEEDFFWLHENKVYESKDELINSL